jgi:photoactive yellow protein
MCVGASGKSAGERVSEMSASVIIVSEKFFGLLELGADGTVLYSRVESEGGGRHPAADITGRNFFSEVAPFLNVGEFREHLDDFRRSSRQANSIHFNCQYEDGPVLVKVLLARVRERSEHDVTKSVLVHIRKAL